MGLMVKSCANRAVALIDKIILNTEFFTSTLSFLHKLMNQGLSEG